MPGQEELGFPTSLAQAVKWARDRPEWDPLFERTQQAMAGRLGSQLELEVNSIKTILQIT